MSYQYQNERAKLFTPEGNVEFIKKRDVALKLIETAGAFRMGEFMSKAGSGDSWFTMAVIDRMVETGELVKLERQCWAQYDVFTTPQVHNR